MKSKNNKPNAMAGLETIFQGINKKTKENMIIAGYIDPSEQQLTKELKIKIDKRFKYNAPTKKIGVGIRMDKELIDVINEMVNISKKQAKSEGYTTTGITKSGMITQLISFAIKELGANK